MNFNVHLFRKPKNHVVLCFMSQFQYRKEIQNLINSSSIYQFIKKKTKRHFRYMDLLPLILTITVKEDKIEFNLYSLY